MKRMCVHGLALTVGLLAGGCGGTNQVVVDGHIMEYRRPVATYSIVARDPNTGEIGVAVQSHWFSVGSVVPWAEAGVGAVATQSLVDPTYGPLGLDLMRLGRSAPDALKALLAGDEGRELRQVAMIDAQGRIAAHSGARCIPAAGQVVDEQNQFSVQANLMANAQVWTAMAEAYRTAAGDLAERMLAALDAAQAAGGDIRGKQSAAIVVVNAASTGKPWIDRRFDLRVEDHPEPLKELRRLVQVQRAYLHMNAGDLAVEHGNFELAGKEYAAAEQFAPHIVEVPFWHAVALASAGKVDQALPIFRRVFETEPIWAELVPKLVQPGLLPDDAELLEKIHEQVVEAGHAYWESRLGQTITVHAEVPTRRAKIGPLIHGGSLPHSIFIDPRYLEGREWPDHMLGKHVRVTGKVIKRHDLPVFVANEGRQERAGIPLPEGTDLKKASLRYLLTDVSWEIVE